MTAPDPLLQRSTISKLFLSQIPEFALILYLFWKLLNENSQVSLALTNISSNQLLLE